MNLTKELAKLVELTLKKGIIRNFSIYFSINSEISPEQKTL